MSRKGCFIIQLVNLSIFTSTNKDNDLDNDHHRSGKMHGDPAQVVASNFFDLFIWQVSGVNRTLPADFSFILAKKRARNSNPAAITQYHDHQLL